MVPGFGESPLVPRPASGARAYPLEDGIWSLRLPVPYPVTPSVNAYLLPLVDGYCLVDCGSSLPPGWEALEVALAAARVEPEQIRLLVCTHLHTDHAGLAAEVVRRTGCTYVRLDAPTVVIDALREPAVPLEWRLRAVRGAGVPEAVVDRMVGLYLSGEAYRERGAAHSVLRPGDVVKTAVGAWRVLDARGHSANQLALFEERRRWLISADLTIPGTRTYIEYGHAPDPYVQHLVSLDGALALRPTLLLPGHGRPDDDAVERLTAAREQTVARAEQIRAAARGELRTPYEVSYAIVEPDADLDRRQSVLSTVFAVLEHDAAHGRAVVEEGADGVRRFRTD